MRAIGSVWNKFRAAVERLKFVKVTLHDVKQVMVRLWTILATALLGMCASDPGSGACLIWSPNYAAWRRALQTQLEQDPQKAATFSMELLP
jgi:hypothetical protein